ncbi:MAG: hypothetical protein DCC65_13480 [Planctomycetota bacterium]|nr:MAG: hypothetical protein DCC65_13480 [Planctomycetota bacterium]
MDRAVIIAGIDEAGYGPILGPLVVSASAFEVPASRADCCLWSLLEGCVANTPLPRDARIPIVDSKKLHKPREGFSRLERTVLACAGAWRGFPPSLNGLLCLIAPDTIQKLRDYAWYAEADPELPVHADAGGVRIAANLLKREMQAAAVRPAGIWSEILPEGHYNRLVGNTQNKAVVLLGLTLRLIQRVGDAFPGHEIRFFVDKQGARDHYAPLLMRAFEDRRLRVVHEDRQSSEYEMVGGGGPWRVSFSESGESLQMPTALASCVSKYLRELLMHCFNAWWSARVPRLLPTAGYYSDGLRFLNDIRDHASALGVTKDMLVRSR